MTYISENKSAGEVLGSEICNGLTTTVLQWKVPQSHYSSAFKLVFNSFYTADFALLRVYVSTDLGYVVPRLEFASIEGEVTCSFSSSDYQDAGGGIYFPRHSVFEKVEGTPQLRYEYQINSIENVNEPISEGAFEISVPQGTRVRSRLPGREAVFSVGESSAGLEEIEKSLGSTDTGNLVARKRWVRNWFLGLNLLFAVLLIAWFHRQKSKGQAARGH